MRRQISALEALGAEAELLERRTVDERRRGRVRRGRNKRSRLGEPSGPGERQIGRLGREVKGERVRLAAAGRMRRGSGQRGIGSRQVETGEGVSSACGWTDSSPKLHPLSAAKFWQMSTPSSAMTPNFLPLFMPFCFFIFPSFPLAALPPRSSRSSSPARFLPAPSASSSSTTSAALGGAVRGRRYLNRRRKGREGTADTSRGEEEGGAWSARHSRVVSSLSPVVLDLGRLTLA